MSFFLKKEERTKKEASVKGLFSNNAQAIALQGLAFLIRSEEPRKAFLVASGLRGEDLRQKTIDPEFLGGVLDFLLSDDALTRSFCNEQNLTVHTLWKVRYALPASPIEAEDP